MTPKTQKSKAMSQPMWIIVAVIVAFIVAMILINIFGGTSGKASAQGNKSISNAGSGVDAGICTELCQECRALYRTGCPGTGAVNNWTRMKGTCNPDPSDYC